MSIYFFILLIIGSASLGSARSSNTIYFCARSAIEAEQSGKVLQGTLRDSIKQPGQAPVRPDKPIILTPPSPPSPLLPNPNSNCPPPIVIPGPPRPYPVPVRVPGKRVLVPIPVPVPSSPEKVYLRGQTPVSEKVAYSEPVNRPYPSTQGIKVPYQMPSAPVTINIPVDSYIPVRGQDRLIPVQVPYSSTKYYPVPIIIYVAPRCRGLRPLQPFRIPGDLCHIHVCRIKYNYVYIDTMPDPACGMRDDDFDDPQGLTDSGMLKSIGDAQALTQAQAQVQAASFGGFNGLDKTDALAQAQAQAAGLSGGLTSTNDLAQTQAKMLGLGGGWSGSSADAFAQAQAHTQSQGLGGGWGGADAQAQALANANAEPISPWGGNSADSYTQAQTQGQGLGSGWGSADVQSLTNDNAVKDRLWGGSSVDALAQAQAQAQGIGGGWGGNSADALTQAQAQSQGLGNGWGSADALTQDHAQIHGFGGGWSNAGAIAQAQGLGGYGGADSSGYRPWGSGMSDAQAQAQAVASNQFLSNKLTQATANALAHQGLSFRSGEEETRERRSTDAN